MVAVHYSASNFRYNTGMAKIDAQNIALTYSSVGEDIHALKGVSFSVEAGEPIAIIGPSGCGKSTILKLIAGLIKPSAGELKINDQVVEKPRKETALILQDYGLLPWKTVIGNAALGLKIAGVKRAAARAKAHEALEVVGLADVEKSYPAQLSGGMKQRLALARSLSLECNILLMDEPLSALDALTREELQNVLLHLWEKRAYTQILVTHSIEEAAFLGRRIVLMGGKPGCIKEVIENPGMGSESYRTTQEYFDICTRVRALLQAEVTRG